MAKKSITGIALRAGGLEWTHLKSGDGERWQVDGSGVDSRPLIDAWPGWGEALTHTQVVVQGEVQSVLPATEILLRVMVLPTIEADEIFGMVELQLDDFSPFPLEQLYIGYELLHQDEQQSHIVVVAAKRKLIDALGEAVREAGSRISRIDLDLLCWWSVLKPKEASGRYIHLFREERSLSVVISDEGLPVHMGILEVLDAEANIEWRDVGEDIEMALLSVEAEYGGADILGVDVWHHGATPSGLDVLEKQFAWTVTTRVYPDQHKLSELALRRGLSTDEVGVDLVPEEWKKSEATRQLKRQFLLTAVAMVAVWIVLAGLGALGVQLGKMKTIKLENRVAEIEAPARQVEVMRRKIQSLSQFTNQTYSALECLRETTILLPPDVELLNWQYRKSSGVTMKGRAANNSPAFTYNGNLAESKLFAEVINGGGSVVRGSWEFKVNALLPKRGAE